MTERYRERAIRAVVGSLLGSNLSYQDLRRLTHELKTGSFTYDLARVLQETLSTIQGVSSLRPISENDRPRILSDKPTEAGMIRRVKSRKLTKERMLQLVDQVSGSLTFSLNPRLPISEMVAEFYKRSSPEQKREFLALVENSVEADPYLKGLANRK